MVTTCANAASDNWGFRATYLSKYERKREGMGGEGRGEERREREKRGRRKGRGKREGGEMVYANAIARTEMRSMVRMGRNPRRQQMDCVDRADKVRFYSFQNSDLHVPF